MSTQFKPVVALVGRANVGKSTLFNRLTRSRDALVANFPGLTRDRHYGEGRVGSHPFLVIDTGGFEPVAKAGIKKEMARQTEQAIDEADIVIFLVDARTGIDNLDYEIAKLLRRCSSPVYLAVNKAEGLLSAQASADFYELGLGEPFPISSAHGDGVVDLIEQALDGLLEQINEDEVALDDQITEDLNQTENNDLAQNEDTDAFSDHRIKLSIVGRPNVGKSTLINSIMGEERVIAFDMPGTTRDAIEIDFERQNIKYTLIDTAGLRRRGKVFETIEKFSVIKTLQAIEASNVAILVLDAQSEISEQDAHIAGFILETGRALVIAINKWDDLDEYNREWIEREFSRKLHFLNFAKVHKISALKGYGVNALLKSVSQAHQAAFKKMSTSRLTRVLLKAIEQQQPPRKGTFRPKLRFAHQGGQNPPRIIIHGNATETVPDSYRRYLESQFRKAFDLQGTPLSVEFKASKNPYK